MSAKIPAYRNPVQTQDGQGVDCEINPSGDGVTWLPFTARASDPEAMGQALYAAIQTAGGIAPAPAPAPAPLPDLRPWQFLGMCDAAGLTTQIETAIKAIADPMQRAVALRRFTNSSAYVRADPLIAQLMASVTYQGAALDSATLDTLWTQAAALA